MGQIQYKSTLCLYILRNFDILLQNGRRTNTRYAILDQRHLSILLNFTSKQFDDVGYIVCKFEENTEPKYRCESAPTVFYKMAAMTSSNRNFQNLRKISTEKHPREYLCAFSSKSAEYFGL